MIRTLQVDVRPTERDLSASVTAVAMGELDYALDLIAACIGITHQLRTDGSCRCGLYATTKSKYGKAA